MVQPTDEQAEAIRLIRSGQRVAVDALAGTGKTTTLELASRGLDRTLYVSFARRNVEEARSRFPAGVECRTAHSLAYEAVGHRHRRRLEGPRSIAPREMIALLPPKLRSSILSQPDPEALMEASWNCVQRFIKSPAHELAEDSLPSSMSKREKRTAWGHVEQIAASLWCDLRSPTGALPFTHDTYLKIWQLDRPRLAFERILFDEAQDADNVMLDIVVNQDVQQVYVGDAYQSIYEWRGAIDAMSSVPIAVRTPLRESFRFGQPIAARANTYLEALGSSSLLLGRATHDSSLGPLPEADVVLCRTNFAAVAGLVRVQRNGGLPALVGGTEDLLLFADSADRLMSRQRPRHPLLLRFRSWDAVMMHIAATPEEQLGELKTMVALVQEHGARRLCAILRRCVGEEQATAVFSTAHKAKGREWDTVKLASDFADSDLSDPEELRVLYVAHTRARRRLDAGAVANAPDPAKVTQPARSNRFSTPFTEWSHPSPVAANGRSPNVSEPVTLPKTTGRRPDGRAPADSTNSVLLTNRQLAAQLRSCGLPTSGPPWEAAKALRSKNLPVTLEGVQTALSRRADVERDRGSHTSLIGTMNAHVESLVAGRSPPDSDS